MEILAHRGAWNYPGEKNSAEALLAALELGFGIETDIRDHNGSLVIAHDVPEDPALKFSDFVESYLSLPRKPMLALNIKADGLTDLLSQALTEVDSKHYFFFDMSIPDTLAYLHNKLPVYVRLSELESESPLLPDAQGIWLDELTGPWLTADTLLSLTRHNKPICIVSPELHGRDHMTHWPMIREVLGNQQGRWLLCTDLPQEAKEYFAID